MICESRQRESVRLVHRQLTDLKHKFPTLQMIENEAITEGDKLRLNEKGRLMMKRRHIGIDISRYELVELGRMLTSINEHINRQSGKFFMDDLLRDVWRSHGECVKVLPPGNPNNGTVLPIDYGDLFLHVLHGSELYSNKQMCDWVLVRYNKRGRCRDRGIVFDGQRVSRHPHHSKHVWLLKAFVLESELSKLLFFFIHR